MSDSGPALPRVAVLIPCYNESVAIGRVVADFRKALPESCVYVYDNNSTDGTAEAARAAGALLGRETAQGKGHVVRRMFADVDADVYVLVDGDATYEAASAPGMVARLLEGQLDMVVGCRAETGQDVFRRGHRFGNALLSLSVGFLFRQRVTDMLSGYRVFSRRFVKSFPVLSAGFEIETELTVHALELAMPVAEEGTPYRARPAGSASKLRTYADGFKILRLILSLYRNEEPMAFFSALSSLLVALSLVLAVPLFRTYLATGLVPRFPTAILCTGFMVIAALGYTCGLILDTVTRGRKEVKKLAYLAVPPWPAGGNR
ncbi:glycosyltransferase family 2 protein [Geothrix edaphica]|uniref:Glycosyl transferase n=1 Tax=Geothrix edaphica TaxID=2927976 RepID=A0ABQ5PZE6_9BACT|nr:glycosyltransferase family 2 protein [Geothrix edaphica]GLH67549.1 glycosyl transferase [Geothrix edaphica]